MNNFPKKLTDSGSIFHHLLKKSYGNLGKKGMSMSTASHTYAVILAGGGGTRLWPKSRNKTPKQFLKLTGKDTMMQVAASRITKVVPWERVIVVTNKQYIDEIKQELPQVPE